MIYQTQTLITYFTPYGTNKCKILFVRQMLLDMLNPKSTISILQDGVCTLHIVEEPTIVIIIIIIINIYY